MRIDAPMFWRLRHPRQRNLVFTHACENVAAHGVIRTPSSTSSPARHTLILTRSLQHDTSSSILYSFTRYFIEQQQTFLLLYILCVYSHTSQRENYYSNMEHSHLYKSVVPMTTSVISVMHVIVCFVNDTF